MARQGPYSGTFAIYHTFHTAEESTADGTAISCAGLAGVGVQLEGISGETITFEGTIDGSTWYAVQTVNRNDGSAGTTATADGLYFADVAGTDQFRARISAGGSGSVTATGYGVTITGGLIADIDIAGAEASTIADGADVAQGTTTDAAASSTVAETTTARTGIGLWKGIKNILVLMNAKFAALGQAAMSASMPVVIASDQSDVQVDEAPVEGAAADVHEPAVNTAAVVTYAGSAGVKHVITGVWWSYSGGIPTGGNLMVEDVSGTTVFVTDITEEGAGFCIFPKPKKAALVNTAMIITLAAGGAGVTGKVSVLSHWTEA